MSECFLDLKNKNSDESNTNKITCNGKEGS